MPFRQYKTFHPIILNVRPRLLPPKRKAAEAAESKMAANVDQSDRIDEVLESKDLIDDGIDLHAQVHPSMVHEQVVGWQEQMLAPVVLHRLLREDFERMMNHTAACRRAPLEAPSAARAWCDDQRADSKAENYLDVNDLSRFGEAKRRMGHSVRPRDSREATCEFLLEPEEHCLD